MWLANKNGESQQAGVGLIGTLVGVGIISTLAFTLYGAIGDINLHQGIIIERDNHRTLIEAIKNKTGRKVRGLLLSEQPSQAKKIIQKQHKIGPGISFRFADRLTFPKTTNTTVKKTIANCNKYSRTSVGEWSGGNFQTRRSKSRTLFCGKLQGPESDDSPFKNISHAVVSFDVQYLDSHSGNRVSMAGFNYPNHLAMVNWTLVWKNRSESKKHKRINSRQGQFLILPNSP